MEMITSIAELFRYGNAANEMVFAAAGALSEEQLDRELDLGPGSVRRIARHLVAGEVTWLARMQGNEEAKWPAVPIPQAIGELMPMLKSVDKQRQTFLASVTPEQMGRLQRYRDSRGELFQATLHEMLLQMIVHATHHRAQLVNAIRRVGGSAPEVDYVYWVRKAV